jgi:hypothetical protein
MDTKTQLGPDVLNIMYVPTADGRKPGRPNFLALMVSLDEKLDTFNAASETRNRNTNLKIDRLQWSVVGLAVLTVVLRLI